ncbi:MAG: cytochrome c maturation protein CcmE [Acidobacteriota bacterium]
MPRLKFIIVGTIMLGAISYLMFSGISDSMVYYYTVSEALDMEQELSNRGIRVSGYVQAGSIKKDNSQSQVEFLVFEKESDQTLPVIYQGIIPDTFKDNAEVLVEGMYRSEEGRFHANVLLAKCPSKYEALGPEHPQDIPIGGDSD